MLSLETAKKLKEAGLRFSLKHGDQLYDESGKVQEIHHISTCRKFVWMENGLSIRELDKTVYIPRLDQLLAEIEKRGYRWDIGNLGYFRDDDDDDDDDVCIGLFDKETREYVAQFLGAIPEEVAAQALSWILEQEKRGQLK